LSADPFLLLAQTGRGAVKHAHHSAENKAAPKIPVKSNLLALLPMGTAAFLKKITKMKKECKRNETRTEPERNQNKNRIRKWHNNLKQNVVWMALATCLQ
jgi:hypothetical protein